MKKFKNYFTAGISLILTLGICNFVLAENAPSLQIEEKQELKPGYVKEKVEMFNEYYATKTKDSEDKKVQENLESLNRKLDLLDKYYDSILENDNLYKQKHSIEEENLKLKKENIELSKKYEDSVKRVARYKRKLEKKKDCVTKQELENEIQKTKNTMSLKFTNYMSDYIKNHPSKKMKNLDIKGLLSDFLIFNINYTNNGSTNISPTGAQVNNKIAGAGVAI